MPIDKRRLVGEQTVIGWRRLFNGQLTKRWAILQDNYLHYIRLRTSSLNGTTWASHSEINLEFILHPLDIM
eukprot:2006744-Ditylum_brightwellii.AAC.1